MNAAIHLEDHFTRAAHVEVVSGLDFDVAGILLDELNGGGLHTEFFFQSVALSFYQFGACIHSAIAAETGNERHEHTA